MAKQYLVSSSGAPASTVGDLFLFTGYPPVPVIMGARTVFIDTGGVGGGGMGSGSSSPQTKAEAALKAGTISPVKGTENYPVEIQAIALVMKDICASKGLQRLPRISPYNTTNILFDITALFGYHLFTLG